MRQAKLFRKLVKKNNFNKTQQALSYYVHRGYVPYKIRNGRRDYKYKKVIKALSMAGLL